MIIMQYTPRFNSCIQSWNMSILFKCNRKPYRILFTIGYEYVDFLLRDECTRVGRNLTTCIAKNNNCTGLGTWNYVLALRWQDSITRLPSSSEFHSVAGLIRHIEMISLSMRRITFNWKSIQIDEKKWTNIADRSESATDKSNLLVSFHVTQI